MRRCTLAQNQADINCYAGPLVKIALKAADCLAIKAVSKQKSIQIELNRMESQKALRKVVGLRHTLAKRVGGVSVLGCQI
ncbi:hypothetical protein thsrh120_59080 [Rhizobium sp. No.120]